MANDARAYEAIGRFAYDAWVLSNDNRLLTAEVHRLNTRILVLENELKNLKKEPDGDREPSRAD